MFAPVVHVPIVRYSRLKSSSDRHFGHALYFGHALNTEVN